VRRPRQSWKENPALIESFSTSYESIGSTSSSLLERVKAHDQAAWERLVKLYGRLLLYWCRRAGVPRADRADVFQEVFRAVAQDIEGFHHDRPGDTFRGWLRTIARHKILDHFRRKDRQTPGAGGTDAYQRMLALPDEQSGEVSRVEPQERAIVAREALKLIQVEFEDRTWQAFWRTAVEGQSASTAAESLEMTPAAVRKAKSRVLCRLRQELEDIP
jgi:RNA polymerase sigma-70 factor, ECF subfamily